MNKKAFNTLDIVPLSKAVVANGFVFLSGDASFDWTTGEFVHGDIRVQTRKTLENLRDTLEALGSSLDKVVKTTVFMTNVQEDFAAMNEVYSEFFPVDPPTRSTFGVADLARKELIVEIELIALA